MQFRISLDLSGFNDSVRRTKAELFRECREAAQAGAFAGRDHAKAGRFKDRTGRLRREIVAIPAPVVFGPEWEIVAPTPYAGFVEYGTAPHWIRPKAGYGTRHPLLPGQSRRAITDIGTHRVALRWYDSSGRVHFAAAVYHPGSRPIPFMRPAGEVAGDVMFAMLSRGFVGVHAIWK